MPNALQTAVAGLSSHSEWLDVIGNNIANVSTTAYKARRAVFSDLVYQNLSAASGGSDNLGGVNPAQVGSGSRLAQIAVNLQQGNFESTGEVLDVALDGDGYFVVTNGSETAYTRAGAFRVDEAGRLVDPSTGFRVQRFGTVGESGTGLQAFQTTGDNDIRVPFGRVIPGQATSTAAIRGNLPSTATGPLQQLLRSPDPFTAAASPATAATLLNALDLNSADYLAGDSLQITGTDAGGDPVSTTLALTASTTLGDLVTAIDSAFAGATAALDAQGRLQLQADAAGPAFLSLALRDAPGNAGTTNWDDNRTIVATNGKDADVARSAVQVFDSRGTAHTLQLEFERQTSGTWDLTATLPTASGTVIDGSAEGLTFNDDGTFALAAGTGAAGPEFTIQFAGQAAPQTIQLAFGTPGSFDGLTSIDGAASIAADQNGSAVGALAAVQISGDGIIEGIGTNGVRLPIAQLAVASFANDSGLESRGQNYVIETVNSGAAVIGGAAASGRGAVRSGELEQSNVDLAYEFTRLIVAQRGFSANARTITVADEMLQELTGLIR